MLLETSFASADLREAKFTLSTENSAFAAGVIEAGGDIAWGPDFTCANLERADFSRQELLSFVEDGGLGFVNPGSYFTAKFVNANLAHADFRSIGIYGAMMPKSAINSQPGAELKFMRAEFPLPMDWFGVSEKPKETDVATMNGHSRTRYLFFQGTVNPSAPLGSDLKKFATSLNRIAEAFAGSNWYDAELPTSLRQWLDQSHVEGSRSGPCARAPR